MFSKVLSFQTHEALSIIQLLTSDQNTMDYISGNSALKNGMIEVKEINEAGSVNDVIVYNASDKYVFFMDGDILSGAKQNRVLNTSVLLAPKSKTVLPVSCVEQGRWHHTSSKFVETDYISPHELRANKAKQVTHNLMADGMHYANQRAVWDNVAMYSFKAGVNSKTSNLSDVFDERKKDYDGFLEKFKLNKKANGLAVFLNRNLLNIDIFNRTDIYSEYFPKMLRGVAMEAYGIKQRGKVLSEAEANFKTVSFLDKFEDLEFESHRGVGIGEERRFESKELTGFELNYDKHLIHLTALNIETGK
jgi:ARG and Rhodanese-Phosphatase-superfamily-associated Protein domain